MPQWYLVIWNLELKMPHAIRVVKLEFLKNCYPSHIKILYLTHSKTKNSPKMQEEQDQKGGFCENLSHSFFPLLSQTPSQFSELFTSLPVWGVAIWQIVVLRLASCGGNGCWVWYGGGLWFGYAIYVVVVARLGSCVCFKFRWLLRFFTRILFEFWLLGFFFL